MNKGENGIFIRGQAVSPPMIWISKDLSENGLDGSAPFPGFNRSMLQEGEDRVPAVRVFENKGDVVVWAKIPGVRMEDIDIRVTDETVTIAAEKTGKGKAQGYRSEPPCFSFCYTSRLPSEVKAYKTRTKFTDGILEIRMPKIPE